MSKRTQKVKNCIDRMPSYPVHYAPFPRNGATNEVRLSTLNNRPKFGEVTERLPTDEVGKMHAQRAPKATSRSKNLVRCPSG